MKYFFLMLKIDLSDHPSLISFEINDIHLVVQFSLLNLVDTTVRDHLIIIIKK